ncbi:MAG: hypothetical protein U1F57_00870 [bacterium]
MRKLGALFFLVFFTGFIPLSFALDPVAPRSERKFGQLMVKSPLPDTDVCELTSAKDSKEPFKQTFKPFENVKVPVGDYVLTVKLQDAEWKTNITIQPTERNDVVVTGYGNLKVKTPNPSKDTVEVYKSDGKLLKTFNPTKVMTIPTGTYNVKVKMNGAEITEPNVVIVTNTTREVSASF